MSTLPKPANRFTDPRQVHMRFEDDDFKRLEIVQNYLKDQGLQRHDASRNAAVRYAVQVAADLIRKQG